MTSTIQPVPRAAWRERLRVIIFEADTPAGKAFDVALLAVIIVSVFAVMLESVAPIRASYAPWLYGLEWVITALFTVEYGLRLICVAQPWQYARSFFGVVDILAILPTYLSLVLPGSQSLLVIRALRLLRIFRVFKLAHYLVEANVLLAALRSSGPKVIVFLGTVLVLVIIIGATMYLVEGVESGFTSIPRSVYWAVVTMTTVGYGDIAPRTVLGQTLAAIVMIMGYSIIAVPTGIVSAEFVYAKQTPVTTRGCPVCVSEGHAQNAQYCKDCGAELRPS
jgi:voltage-gated potassium channel